MKNAVKEDCAKLFLNVAYAIIIFGEIFEWSGDWSQGEDRRHVV